ncbi:MAG: class I mannose-6-phosphate isomerase [Defluviitaleaceae bacterium]|nr:class I mannose-6-phosphate isomerase [Defluviitaleaceae bacterium]
MKLYPILLRPIFKKMIWGSESWEITCRPDEMGIIENGPAAGEAFAHYIGRNSSGVLGTRFGPESRFPLLVKIIDAKERLSVQVHPTDAYAKAKGETDSGKSEMWYIIKPPECGFLIIGLKPSVTRESLAAAYKNGTVESCLNRLRVREGDIVNIPAGLVHAITAGTIVAEIQQNSDITYRLYDYNRTDDQGKTRPLHIEDALAVSDYEGKIPKTAASAIETTKIGANLLTRVISDEYFDIKKYELSGPLNESSNRSEFAIFTCVEGDAVIEAEGISVEIPMGRSVFLPAALGSYTIRPKDKLAVLLKCNP